MRRWRLAAAAALVLAGPAVSETRHTLLSFDDLDGWAVDDHAAALDAFRETCTDLPQGDWPGICAVASHVTDARAFFEMLFLPVLVEDSEPALFTGYFEPELKGSRVPTDRHRWPLYRTPPDLPGDGAWHTRAEIEKLGLLKDRNLEIAWIDDPVDVFFLQVQGSGRIALEDGSNIRVGYGGRNGHEYRSVGQEMVRRGIYEPHQVSAAVIRNWVRRNPDEGAELLHHNPSFIFFRELGELPPEKGPLGAMNRPVTVLRSVAVDPAFTPLGAPVWIEKDGADPLRRLMIAQDTGSAIKGAQRADIFFGSGAEAGRQAGRIKDGGRMVVLLPVAQAYALAEGPEG
jgi:membrane-bound lytic murein transglycosylase A